MKDLALKAINTIHIALVEMANLFIIGMVAIVFANVVLRYAFQSSILWSEEISLLLCVWFIFISFGLGIKQRLHITINLFHRERVGKLVNLVLDVLAEAVAIVIGGTMIIYGARLVQFTMTSIMPATKWPAGILYIVVPFSGLIIVLEAILHLVGWDTYDANIDDYLSGGRKFKDIFGGGHE